MRQAVLTFGASLGLTLVGVCAFQGGARAEDTATTSKPAPAIEDRVAARDEPAPVESDCRLAVQLEGKPLARVKLSLDGQPVPAERLGAALETSPGRHVVTAVVGLKKVDLVTHLQPGEQKTLRVPVPAAPPAALALTLPSIAPPESEREPVLSQAWQRSAGLVVGGAGVLGLGVAGAFFANAMHKRAEAARACNGPGACEPKARLSMDAKANESSNIAAVAAVTGLTLAGAGAILYLTAPSPPGLKDLKFSPTFASGVGGGISAKGTF